MALSWVFGGDAGALDVDSPTSALAGVMTFVGGATNPVSDAFRSPGVAKNGLNASSVREAVSAD